MVCDTTECKENQVAQLDNSLDDVKHDFISSNQRGVINNGVLIESSKYPQAKPVPPSNGGERILIERGKSAKPNNLSDVRSNEGCYFPQKMSAIGREDSPQYFGKEASPRYIMLYEDAMRQIKARKANAVNNPRNAKCHVKPHTIARCDRLYDLCKEKKKKGKMLREAILKERTATNFSFSNYHTLTPAQSKELYHSGSLSHSRSSSSGRSRDSILINRSSSSGRSRNSLKHNRSSSSGRSRAILLYEKGKDKVKSNRERAIHMQKQTPNCVPLSINPKNNVRCDRLYSLSKKCQVIGKERREQIEARAHMNMLAKKNPTSLMKIPKSNVNKDANILLSPRLMLLYNSGRQNIRTKKRLSELQKLDREGL